MRNCPTCNEPIADTAICCNSCGWTAETTISGKAVDPMRALCAYTDHVGRCSKLGRFSETTRGFDNPDGNGNQRWYCEQHFAPFRRRFASGPPVAMPEHVRARLNALKGWKPAAVDAEAIAERAAIQADSGDAA